MIGLRALWGLLEAVLLVVCASYWFGNTGAGLALLWLAVPDRLRFEPGEAPRLEAMRPIRLGCYRVCLRGADGRRHEIYRDELSPAQWAALKRRCFSAQLATGRSTSI